MNGERKLQNVADLKVAVDDLRIQVMLSLYSFVTCIPSSHRMGLGTHQTVVSL